MVLYVSSLSKPTLHRQETYFKSDEQGNPRCRVGADGRTYKLALSNSDTFCLKQFSDDGKPPRECTKTDLEAWLDAIEVDTPHYHEIRWEISKMCFGKKTRDVLRKKSRSHCDDIPWEISKMCFGKKTRDVLRKKSGLISLRYQ